MLKSKDNFRQIYKGITEIMEKKEKEEREEQEAAERIRNR